MTFSKVQWAVLFYYTLTDNDQIYTGTRSVQGLQQFWAVRYHTLH